MTAQNELAVRYNHSGSNDGVDRTDHSARPLPHLVRPAPPPVDRVLHEGAPHRVTIHPGDRGVAAPARTGPQSVEELNKLLADRAREQASQNARDLDPRLSLAAQTGSALAILDAAQSATRPADTTLPLETEARRRLQDAINVRAGVREAVAAQERALAMAKAVESEAVTAEERSRTAEIDGADALARQIAEWATKGGETPELAPDPRSLDARHAADRARVAATAARQAARAIDEVLETKRHALAQAEETVKAAARGVVEAVAENIAMEGRKAGIIHRRAEMAALALSQMHYGVGVRPIYQAKPETAGLAQDFTGPRKNEPANMLEGAKNTWRDFQAALETDADAALG